MSSNTKKTTENTEKTTTKFTKGHENLQGPSFVFFVPFVVPVFYLSVSSVVTIFLNKSNGYSNEL